MANYIITVYFRTLDTLDIQVVEANDWLDLTNKIEPTITHMCGRNCSLDVELVSIVQGDRKGGIFD